MKKYSKNLTFFYILWHDVIIQKKKWFKDFHIFQFTMAWFNNAMIKWFKDSHIFYFTMTWFDNVMKIWFKDSHIFQYNMTWFDNSMKSDSKFLHYPKFHETNNNTKKKRFRKVLYILVEISFNFTHSKFSILKWIVISQIHSIWMVLHHLQMMMKCRDDQ